MKKVVVVNGHPDQESFNSALSKAYINAAKRAGAEVRFIPIGELNFNPNLRHGYRKRMELEPDLIKALDDLKWSEHQVWIHPLWWLGIPALMKGFFDRAFLPGITFKSEKGVSKGLLTSKTARIITTAGDLSENAYREIYNSSGLTQLKNGILEYCGVDQVKSTFIGPLDELNDKDKNLWIEKIGTIARYETEIIM